MANTKPANNTINSQGSVDEFENSGTKLNHFLELLKYVRKLYPEIFKSFNEAGEYDLRNKNRTIYTMGFILFLVFMKNLLSYVSMRSFWISVDTEYGVQNILFMAGISDFGFNKLPCFQTVNDFMSILDPKFLEDLLFVIFRKILDGKYLNNYRFRRMWVIAVDATEIYNGRKKMHDKCLYRVHNKGQASEYTEYYISVLVASLVLVGTKVSLPFCCVFIENNAEDADRQRNMSVESIKQDCETKAFKRMAQIFKSRFRNMNICFLFDSLYANKPIMEICYENNWDFIIRYKVGAYKEIQENVDGLNKKHLLNYLSDDASAKFDYRDVYYTVGIILSASIRVNFVHATSILAKEKYASFQWITSLQITDYRVYQTINVGRARWLIENQTFHRLKKWSNNIEHLCCWNEFAIKNHFRMILIAEIFRIIYEFETFCDSEENKKEGQVEKPPFYRIMQLLSNSFWNTLLSDYEWTKLHTWEKRGRGRPKKVSTA